MATVGIKGLTHSRVPWQLYCLDLWWIPYRCMPSVFHREILVWLSCARLYCLERMADVSVWVVDVRAKSATKIYTDVNLGQNWCISSCFLACFSGPVLVCFMFVNNLLCFFTIAFVCHSINCLFVVCFVPVLFTVCAEKKAERFACDKMNYIFIYHSSNQLRK